MQQHSALFLRRDCLSGASSSRVLDDSGQVKRRTCGLLQHAGCHPAAFSDITVAITTMIATKFDTFLSALCLGHVMPHALPLRLTQVEVGGRYSGQVSHQISEVHEVDCFVL